jgi:hypothetical protein
MSANDPKQTPLVGLEKSLRKIPFYELVHAQKVESQNIFPKLEGHKREGGFYENPEQRDC